jgi:membrane protein
MTARSPRPPRHRTANAGDPRGDQGDRPGSPPGAPPGEWPVSTGQFATSPGQIPLPGWMEILGRVAEGIRGNQVALLAAGVAFFAMLALVPAMVAVVSVYGLVVTPEQAARQMASLTRALPPEAQQLVSNQLQTVARSSTGHLGTGLAIGLAGALWSASTGMRWMMTALSLVYDETETRRYLRLRGQALVMTAGALVALVVSLGTLLGLPAAFDAVGLAGAGRTAADVGRFPVLGIGLVGGLGILYRFGPDRRQPQWRWVSYGSVLATVLWLLGSAGLSLYAANVSRFAAAGTYGTLGAVVVLMLWLYLTAFAIILGGVVNAEVEHQTSHDSTVGPDRPRGQRRATMADEVAGWPSRAAGLELPPRLDPDRLDPDGPVLDPEAGPVDREEDPVDE